ncbi:MAG: hypothetical protein A4E31_00866 [Methanomassiliicoccales archaeon PtaU1.Bin030]|nr:MAG: hypothetical protein A4E31_00866 [Methanomassiliicoccales archaeon PtaU1.Bin030]
MSLDSRPKATAATTPVPVIPLALQPPLSWPAPLEGSTLEARTGLRASSRTTLSHRPSSRKLRSDIAKGAASIPYLMACPSIAGPAAADPVYNSPSWNSPISALVP